MGGRIEAFACLLLQFRSSQRLQLSVLGVSGTSRRVCYTDQDGGHCGLQRRDSAACAAPDFCAPQCALSWALSGSGYSQQGEPGPGSAATAQVRHGARAQGSCPFSFHRMPCCPRICAMRPWHKRAAACPQCELAARALAWRFPVLVQIGSQAQPWRGPGGVRQLGGRSGVQACACCGEAAGCQAGQAAPQVLSG